jgi:hypothetical protein
MLSVSLPFDQSDQSNPWKNGTDPKFSNFHDLRKQHYSKIQGLQPYAFHPHKEIWGLSLFFHGLLGHNS